MKILIQTKPGSKQIKIEKIGKDPLTGFDIYTVKLTEKPIKGKANKQLIEVLSSYFNIPKNKIKLLKGNTKKYKLIEIKK